MSKPPTKRRRLELSLDDKVKLIKAADAFPKPTMKVLGETFCIGKSTAADIIKKKDLDSMMSLSKLIAAKAAKPYTSPVKITIVEIGKTTKYKTEKGEDKEVTTIGACDKDHAIKLTVYDNSKVTLMKKGTCVMLLNYICKHEPESIIVITNKTKVMQTSPMVDISDEVKQSAKDFANPPPARLVVCKAAKQSPIKSLISVQGKVISEEAVRTVKVKGADVCIKNNIRDTNDTLTVALWRNLTDSSLIGQYIKLNNVLITSYKDEVSVSTTTLTLIEDCQEPVATIEGMVVAYEEGELTYSLMIESGENFSTYDVPVQMIITALDEETLSDKIPAQAALEIEKGMVVYFNL